MQYRILGSLEVQGDDGPLPLGGAKQLAVLLLRAGRVVTCERLIDDLWGDAPPETARTTVQCTSRGVMNADGTHIVRVTPKRQGVWMDHQVRPAWRPTR